MCAGVTVRSGCDRAGLFSYTCVRLPVGAGGGDHVGGCLFVLFLQRRTRFGNGRVDHSTVGDENELHFGNTQHNNHTKKKPFRAA